MPKSAPVTRQFVKDEIFKQSTLFAKALNQILARFDQLEEKMDKKFENIDQRFESIDQRFESIDQRFESIDQRFDSLDKKFITKQEWSGDMSQIMGELKHIREEQQANYSIDVRQNKRLDALETHLNLAVA